MRKDQIKNLPAAPGVYIMRSAQNEIIYVGKAKNLKNRVSQYFRPGQAHPAKVAAMVSMVEEFEYIITDSEFEALVLECNLIKEHRPRYNVLLKDDKHYPYIKITLNEPFPRILLARRIENDGARYFGPYLNSGAFQETMDIAKKTFAVRSCSRVLPRDIGKDRPCLHYYIKQCSAPCDAKISQEEYRKIFDDIIALLEGKQSEILDRLTRQMEEAARDLEFERAAKLRDKIAAVSNMAQKQKIISTTPGNQDVIAMAKEGDAACVTVFFIRFGKVVGRENHLIRDAGAEPQGILTEFMKEYYAAATSVPKTILVQGEVEDRALMEQWLSEKCRSAIQILSPKRGEKLTMVRMVEKNAIEALNSHLMQSDRARKKIDGLLFEMKELLGLKAAPMRIEAYDISNISGTDSVGVCVVFENGQPRKRDYKKFNIRSVEGANDYESMKEVLYRRLSRGIDGAEGFVPLPDLILLDGGAGHVTSSAEILDFFQLEIPFFGMVKDDRHRTRGLTNGREELAVRRQSASFLFLTRIQDEVHRFALASHHQKRKKSASASRLEEIPGVGPKRRAVLLQHFKSVKAIQSASLDALSAVPGIDRGTAEKIFSHFHDTDA